MCGMLKANGKRMLGGTANECIQLPVCADYRSALPENFIARTKSPDGIEEIRTK
jgi:hypothetical protein